MNRFILIVIVLFFSICHTYASMTKEQLEVFIDKPFTLGKKNKDVPVWEVLDENKKLHSYIFESFDFAPTYGFSGGEMNLLIEIDVKDNFQDIYVLEQDEPVFVSGLGIEPFKEFLKQYKGKFIKSSIKVGNSGDKTSSVRIDGVTKATASVNIANDTILGATARVLKILGNSTKTIYHPKKDLYEKYTWDELVENKLVKHFKVTQGEMESLFEDTEYEKKLSQKQKDEIALDLYVTDLNIPSTLKNLLNQSTQNDIKESLKEKNEAVMIFANGSYKILTDKFVPGSSPDELEIKQDGFTLNIKDGNYLIEFLNSVPKFDQSIILEVDKRYDFDPSSPWILRIKVVRGNNNIFLTPIVRYLKFDITPIKKYFDIPNVSSTIDKAEEKIKEQVTVIKKVIPQKIEPKNLEKKQIKEEKSELVEPKKEEIVTKIETENLNENIQIKEAEPIIVEKSQPKTPFWLQTIYEQKVKLISLTLFLSCLFIFLFKYKMLLQKLRLKRMILLAITLFFIGWYGQGQLSMVTVVGTIKAIVNSKPITFLLYDPFSLIIWFFVFLSLVIWGRGTFCGWLCPYGVLQEFSYYLGRLYKLPTIRVSENLNKRLVYIKYFILEAFILSIYFEPSIAKYLMEVEPFKTSITLMFDRDIPYVVYALFWIVLGMFLFRGFCRYVCPLGAFLAILGKLRFWDWLPRRFECGNPCNNCHKNCNYQAIDEKDGHINYTDCFQCLDCVQIYSDNNLCKVLKKDMKVTKWSEKND